MATLAELIRDDQSARKDSAELDAFVAGTREGAFGVDGKWWLGPRLHSSADGYAAALVKIKQGFVVQNLLGTVLDNHVDALLTREPDWEFGGVPAGDVEALTRWTLLQRVLKTFYAAARTLQYAPAGAETSSLLRLYVPARSVPGTGLVPRDPLETQLQRRVRLQHPATSQGGVLYEDGDPVAAYYRYTVLRNGQRVDVLELSALDTEFAYRDWSRRAGAQTLTGETVVQLRTGQDWSTIAGEASYPLGGALTITEMRRPPLITEDIVLQQAALNTHHTYLNKGAGASVFLERVILDGLPPGKWVDKDGNDNPAGPFFKPDPYVTGPGTTNFVQGVPYGADRSQRSRPDIRWHEPSDLTPLLKTIDSYRYTIHELVNQLHFLISGDATATGVSRQQATAAFVSSLTPTKNALKDGLAWALTTALRLAGYFATGGESYRGVEADVRLYPQAAPPTPEEVKLWLELKAGGILSEADVMARYGVANPEEMRKQIAAERTQQPEVLTP